MSGARTSSRYTASEPVFVLPAGAPDYCDVLVMGEAEAKRVIEHGSTTYTLGPRSVLRRKKHAAAVERRRANGPYVTVDCKGVRRGIYASWAATAMAMVALALEFEERRG